MDKILQVAKAKSKLEDLREVQEFLQDEAHLLSGEIGLDVVRAFLVQTISGLEFWIYMKEEEIKSG